MTEQYSTTDTLEHLDWGKHKYIKKYKTSSGKTRYVYADSKRHDIISGNLNNAYKNQRMAKASYEVAQDMNKRLSDDIAYRAKNHKRSPQNPLSAGFKQSVLDKFDRKIIGNELRGSARFKQTAKAYNKRADNDIERFSVGNQVKDAGHKAARRVSTVLASAKNKASSSKLSGFIKNFGKTTTVKHVVGRAAGTPIKDLPWSNPIKQELYKQTRRPR